MDTTLSPAATLRPRQPAPAGTLVRLPAHATLARELAAGACISVQSGRIWLTQTGDANDYFVGAGQRHVVARPGRVVIESFTALALLRIGSTPPATRPGFP